MIWTAGFRTAVISPYEQIQLTEPRGFADQTVRQVLHMAGGGERLRVRLTNRYGRTPLTIAAATAATEHGQAVLTFDGAEKLTIPPGDEAAADPVDLPVAPGADLFLSLYFEGVGSTTSANNRSVDFLNRRLKRGWVVNQGIAGNRLLRDEVGEHALGRFDRDVLSIPGLTHVLVHFGINDLGLPGMSGEPPVTSGALIEGFRALAHRARNADLKILAATIGPFAGAVYPGVSTPEGLAARREVNDWIRTTGTFDAVFDVARAVENPEAPDYIHPALDGGDGMHLNDKGAQAMANAVDPETLAL